MLQKSALVTVIPGTPRQDYRAASHTCYGNPPYGYGGDTNPPTNPSDPPPDGLVVPDGTPIYLLPNGSDGYGSVAPAPSGYVCRREVIFVYAPGQTEPAATYTIVCSEG